MKSYIRSTNGLTIRRNPTNNASLVQNSIRGPPHKWLSTVIGIADFTGPRLSENAYKLWFNWTVRAAVVQSHHLNSQIWVLAGSLVYDTGFPFQSGNSREPGFESRRPHHDFIL